MKKFILPFIILAFVNVLSYADIVSNTGSTTGTATAIAAGSYLNDVKVSSAIYADNGGTGLAATSSTTITGTWNFTKPINNTQGITASSFTVSGTGAGEISIGGVTVTSGTITRASAWSCSVEVSSFVIAGTTITCSAPIPYGVTLSSIVVSCDGGGESSIYFDYRPSNAIDAVGTAILTSSITARSGVNVQTGGTFADATIEGTSALPRLVRGRIWAVTGDVERITILLWGVKND